MRCLQPITTALLSLHSLHLRPAFCRSPYSPATLAAVQHLAEAGLKVFILSNSSRRSDGTILKLQKMGFQAQWFAGECSTHCTSCSHLGRSLGYAQ